MAFVSSSNISLPLRGSSAAISTNLNLKLFLPNRKEFNVGLTNFAPSSTVLAFARRKNSNSAITLTSKKKKKSLQQSKDVEVVEEGDIDEDAFEALFKQLEEDLKNDEEAMGDEGDEISEEDLVRLEREIEEALGEDGDLLEMFKSTVEDMERSGSSEVEDEDDEEEEDDESEEEEEDEKEDDGEEELAKLKNWQIRRLASALKVGRRKTSIKSLAGELCLDRSIVLKLLRDPPPRLLLVSAALPERPTPVITEPEAKLVEIVPDEETEENVEEPQSKPDEPVHVMQGRWSAQKRLKKVQVETLERVYRRTKRPTNAMISSIVHVTNLPRKRVVKWFEDKREEDGVPVHRLPYQRSAPDTVFSQ